LSKDEVGVYNIDKIYLNDRPIEKEFVMAENLGEENRWEIWLSATENKASGRIHLLNDLSRRNIFGPKQPQWKGDITAEGGKLKLRYDANGENDVRFNIYSNGQLCAKGISQTEWTDPDSTDFADKTYFYTVEAFYPDSGNCSHLTPVNFYCPKDNRIEIAAASMKNTGGNLVDNHHFENWGGTNHQLQIDSWTVNKSGRYLFSVQYSNGAGPINTGVTCGVKRIEITEAGGSKPVASSYLIMPHTADWKRYLDSSTFGAELKEGKKYSIKIFEDDYARNMSYFDHYESYKNTGNGADSYNYVNIASLDAIRIN
jgi:hypothetical protein